MSKNWPFESDQTRSRLLGRAQAAEARVAELTARVGELEAALEWTVPLAEIALEECRLERLRTGNRDIGKEEGHPGLWPIEVAAKTRARQALSGLSDEASTKSGSSPVAEAEDNTADRAVLRASLDRLHEAEP